MLIAFLVFEISPKKSIGDVIIVVKCIVDMIDCISIILGELAHNPSSDVCFDRSFVRKIYRLSMC